MSGHTRYPNDPVYRAARLIADYVVCIKGSIERKDHEQAIERIRYLRTRLMWMGADLRREALDYFKQHRGKSYV